MESPHSSCLQWYRLAGADPFVTEVSGPNSYQAGHHGGWQNLSLRFKCGAFGITHKLMKRLPNKWSVRCYKYTEKCSNLSSKISRSAKWCCQMPLKRDPIYHDIAHTTAMTATECESKLYSQSAPYISPSPTRCEVSIARMLDKIDLVIPASPCTATSLDIGSLHSVTWHCSQTVSSKVGDRKAKLKTQFWNDNINERWNEVTLRHV